MLKRIIQYLTQTSKYRKSSCCLNFIIPTDSDGTNTSQRKIQKRWFSLLFNKEDIYGKYKGSVVIALTYHMFYLPFYSQTAASLSQDDV